MRRETQSQWVSMTAPFFAGILGAFASPVAADAWALIKALIAGK
jgi:hypothetical protein